MCLILHPVGAAFLGMHTQSLALLAALKGMESVTNRILLLVSLLRPPAPFITAEEGSQSPRVREVIKHVLGWVAKGLLWIREPGRRSGRRCAASPGQCLD